MPETTAISRAGQGSRVVAARRRPCFVGADCFETFQGGVLGNVDRNHLHESFVFNSQDKITHHASCPP